MSSSEAGDFYCSEKFNWLSVDLEKRQSFSCCAARPEQLDIHWIKQNSGQLFCTPVLKEERKKMLQNQPVESCEDVCWKPERENLTSRRQTLNTTHRIANNVDVTNPQKLHVILGSTCNMTCSYCCKFYSTSWLRDIANNGPYLELERFQITNKERVLAKLSHIEQQSSDGFQTLLTEVQTFSDVKEIFITGGEPFLYNNLPTLLNKFSEIGNELTCFTGLGVHPKRFLSQLKKIKNKNKLTFAISAETCESLYEFNRFGNTWKNFLLNLHELEQQGFNFYFSMVLSNLTIFGLLDFVRKFSNKKFEYQFCTVPDFLNVNVLDDISKENLILQIQNSDLNYKDSLIRTLSQSCSYQQKQNFAVYIKEFARRRNLSLDIYPEHFCSWIDNNWRN
jgi:molybdenum cofactor biosynthesis enzyme MoaA